MTTFIIWYCCKVNKTVLTQADFEGQAYEVVKAFYPDVVQLQFQMEECHKMLTDQVDWTNPEGDQVIYLRYGSKESSPALSISKMKAASYPDFGLELLVPERIHDSSSRRKDVRTHMRILSVIRIKAYSRYKLKYTPPARSSRSSSWFRQPGWNATGYEFKHDYTIIESPRAVVFPVNNNERKIMRFNEIYKFSDGTLTRILEALDYRVKEFKVKRLNPGMNS
ncbi:hypothetical protein Tco_1358626 [Tanacetum coccineum]